MRSIAKTKPKAAAPINAVPKAPKVLTETEMLDTIREGLQLRRISRTDYQNLLATLKNEEAWTESIFRILMNAYTPESDEPLVWLLTLAPKRLFTPDDVKVCFQNLGSLESLVVISKAELYEPAKNPDQWTKVRSLLEGPVLRERAMVDFLTINMTMAALERGGLSAGLADEMVGVLRKRIAKSVAFLKAKAKNQKVGDDSRVISFEIFSLQLTQDIHEWSPSVVESLVDIADFCVRTGESTPVGIILKYLPEKKQTSSVKKAIRDLEALKKN